MEPGNSRIEKALNIEFTSDPRRSRFPLPEAPKGHPKDTPYPFPPQLITPEVAKDWIQHRLIRQDITPKELKHADFRPNRRFVLASLYGNQWKPGLIQIIQEGHWNEKISQGIAFTPEGYISDGQHRLAAIALAKKAVKVIITIQAGWDAFDVTDAGRVRTAAQMLGEMPHGQLATRIARHLFPVIFGNQLRNFTSREATMGDLNRLVLSWPFFHETESFDGGHNGGWLSAVKQASKDSGVPESPLGAVTIGALAAGGNPDEVQRFLNGLRIDFKEAYETIGTDGQDPRYLLRNLYHGPRSKGRQPDAVQHGNAGVIRRAMTIWMERHTEDPNVLQDIKVQRFQRVPFHKELPDFWNSEGIVKFHESQLD